MKIVLWNSILWFVLVVGVCAAILTAAGCTVITADQKTWITDKANRSGAFVELMDGGATTRAEEQAWIRSQDRSWKLWAEKVKIGLAAPSWAAGGEQ